MSPRRPTARIAAALSALALLPLARPAVLHAQSELGVPGERAIQFGLGGGVIVPRDGASFREISSGAQGQGFVLVRLPGGLPPLRFNVDYARMKFARPTARVGTALLDTAAAARTTLAGVAGMRVDLLRGPVRPYVVAGLGAFSVTDAVEQAGTTRDFSHVNFGVDGGAGLSIRVGPVSAFAEARLQNVYTRREGLIDTKSITHLPVTFGISF